MQFMLYTLEWKAGEPSLEEVLQKFTLQPDEVDTNFGVMKVDPEAGLYCIMADSDAIARITGSEAMSDSAVSGPFSNPRIEGFGLEN